MKGSLNGNQRRKNMMRISLENQSILKRLQRKKPTFSVEKWKNDFKQHTYYRENLQEQPYEFGDGLGLL